MSLSKVKERKKILTTQKMKNGHAWFAEKNSSEATLGKSGLGAPFALSGHTRNAPQVYRFMCAKTVTVTTVIKKV